MTVNVFAVELLFYYMMAGKKRETEKRLLNAIM